MCLITVKPQGVSLPKDEYLTNGERTNKDGIGCAFWKHGTSEVRIKKDFKDIKEFLDWMHVNVVQEDSLLIHFRYATSGLKDEGNRHPFPLVKDGSMLREVNLTCDYALVHNGVLPDLGNHDKYSDTQKFVMCIMADDAIKNNLDSPGIRTLILDFIGRDRLAILSNTGKITVFGEYEKEDGLLFSNSSYKISPYKSSGISNWWGWRDREIQETPLLTNQQKQKFHLYEEGINSTCDGCGKKTWVRYFPTATEHECLLLCKKCRKLARKEKLKVNGKIVIEGSSTDDDLNSSVGETLQIMCESCRCWYPQSRMINYNGIRTCDECVNDIQSCG